MNYVVYGWSGKTALELATGSRIETVVFVVTQSEIDDVLDDLDVKVSDTYELRRHVGESISDVIDKNLIEGFVVDYLDVVALKDQRDSPRFSR